MATPRHDWDYGYGAVAACGTTNPGLNNNRTTMSDSKAGGTPTTTTYCYDNADRIVSSATTNAPSGANAVVDGLAASELGMRRTGLTTLAPTDSTVCTAAYTVVPGDASASRISNTAEAVASYSVAGAAVTVTAVASTAVVTVDPALGLALTGTSSPVAWLAAFEAAVLMGGVILLLERRRRRKA